MGNLPVYSTYVATGKPIGPILQGGSYQGWAITSTVEARSRTQRRTWQRVSGQAPQSSHRRQQGLRPGGAPGRCRGGSVHHGRAASQSRRLLQQSGRHAVEEVPKAERATEGFSLLQIFGLRRPAAAHQQVEGEGFREDVVFVELRCPRHAPPPALRPKRLPVEALEEELTGLRQAQASEKGGEGGLAATGGAFEEDAVTRADPQVATSENGLAPLVVAEDEVTRIEDRLSVLSLGRAGAERQCVGRRPTDLWTSPSVEEGGAASRRSPPP